MSEKEPDEYCKKIFKTLVVSEAQSKNAQTRFNELHRKLADLNVKMSKPTLILHLNHLLENDLIKRDSKDKQTVTYEINYQKLDQLKDTLKFNAAIARQVKGKATFNNLNLSDQIATIADITILEAMYYLRLQLLDIITPSNKLAHSYEYLMINGLLGRYTEWLLESCRESKDKSEKSLKHLNKFIEITKEALFTHPPSASKTEAK